MKKLKKAIRSCKRFVDIAFKGSWLAAKTSYYYNNPLMLPLSYISIRIFRKLVDKHTSKIKHKEIMKSIKSAKKAQQENKLIAKMLDDYDTYLKNSLGGSECH